MINNIITPSNIAKNTSTSSHDYNEKLPVTCIFNLDRNKIYLNKVNSPDLNKNGIDRKLPGTAIKKHGNTYEFKRNNDAFIKNDDGPYVYSIKDLLKKGLYMPEVLNWDQIPNDRKIDAYEALLFRNRLISKKITERLRIHTNAREYMPENEVLFYDERTKNILIMKLDYKLQSIGITHGNVYNWSGDKVGGGG